MITINPEKCIGCSLCIKDCFVRDLSLVDGKAVANNKTCFKCGHCIAICPQNAVSTTEYNMAEVKDYDAESFTINADHLLNFIKFRRTIRHFKKQDVETDKLLKIIEAGRFTQTGSNAQNVSYIVVKDNLDTLKAMTFDTLAAMGKHLLSKEDTSPLHKRYAQMWINMAESYKQDPKQNDSLFFNAPAIILTVSSSPINASLASSNMELMTNALGLGTFFSGFFTRAAESNKAISQFLGISETDQIVTCMVIGYPKVKYARTVPRKPATITWK